ENLNGVALQGVGFVLTLPAGLSFVVDTDLSEGCGVEATGTLDGPTLAVDSVVIPAGGSCVVTGSVRGDAAGSYTVQLPAGAVISAAGANAAAISAALGVGDTSPPPSPTPTATPTSAPTPTPGP